jgi:hypothetical protein
MKWPIAFALLLILVAGSWAALRDLPYKEKYEAQEFSIKFQPVYPLVIGEETQLNLSTQLAAEDITIHLPDGSEIHLEKKLDLWTGKFAVSEDFKEGWQAFHIYIKHRVPIGYKPFFDQVLEFFRLPTETRYKSELLAKRIWVRAFLPLPPPVTKLPAVTTLEALPLSPEAQAIMAETVTPEVVPLTIKGTRLFSFTSKSIEGTKEGYIPGINREESLRINVSGKVSDTDVDANFFSTSSLSTTQVASQEQKISIKLSRASTEAYFGDFTADLTDCEFSRLNQVLSGVKLSGDYEKWSFKVLASTPQGQSRLDKMYGNGTQGPYALSSAPVVIDSEQVWLDGVLQKRGNDYEIDYQAGTVTFNSRTILKTSIIEIDYDYRSTLYNHSTYAVRTKAAVSPQLKLGATWIDDSDSLKDAQGIFQNQASGTLEPQSHYIVGMDGSLGFSDLLIAQGEVAYSEKRPRLITQSGSQDIGKAAKLDTISVLGPFGLQTRFKRIGPKFEPAAEALPKQDLWEYGGLLTYRPNSLLFSSLNLASEKFTQAGTRFNNVNRNAKLKLSVLQYLWDEFTESNDPVPPYAPFDRLTIKNTYDLTHTAGHLNLSAQTKDERRISRSPSEEVTTYKTNSFGLSTAGLEKFTASANLELKETLLPSGTTPYTRTYNLNLSASPQKEYLASVALNYIDDSQDGITNVTDLTYRAEPSEKLRTDGKYTITSVKETFGASQEGVLKNVGSFKLELRPLPSLRLRYYYKPNYTLVSRTQNLSYNNETQQYEFNWAVLASAMLGATYKTNQVFSVDKTDYPNYRRRDSSSDSRSQLYSLKAAPLRFLSCELNFNLDDSISYALLAPATLEAYQRTNTSAQEFNTSIKTSLSERFAIDSSYNQKLSLSGTDEAKNDQTNTLSQTGSLKGIWNTTDFLTVSLSYAYTLTTNFLAVANQETYTHTPGAGFIYRYGDAFRLDGDYSYSRSFAGAVTEKQLYSLRGKYDISEYLHITLRMDREISFQPDYKTSDFYGNIEINL